MLHRKNFCLTIEYDGSSYCGWQKQKNDPTIQEVIENAIEKMTKEKITLSGSGRTDAGVHALGQVANFRLETRLNADIFQKGLNSLLPDDILIKDCREVEWDFHSRFAAKSKLYQYRILNRPLPAVIGRQYVWHVPKPLDMESIQQALTHIAGKQDFKSFEGSGSPRSQTVRTVFRAEIFQPQTNLVYFEIEADGFLKHMVRNIVGTLVYIGQNQIPPEQIKTILEKRDRNLAGPTAPARGLFLLKVNYR